MKIVEKQWIQLTELSGESLSRISYVRLDAIDRISVVENEPENEYRASVFVQSAGVEYLYEVLINDRDALKHAESLIEDIEKATAVRR